MLFYQGFRITGVANKTTYDAGLESTQNEPKTLRSILVQVSDYKDNDLEGWIEKARVLSVPDKLLDTIAGTGSTNMQYAATRLLEIPVGVALAVGQLFQAAINCGADATDLVGCYVYEITA